MAEENIRGKVVGLFLLGCILFSYPVFTLFNVRFFIFGVPLLFVYIFLAWLGVIGLIFGFAHTHLRSSGSDTTPPGKLPGDTE